MELTVTNPNFTVIMPGGCNGKCSFCYWKPDVGLTLERLKFVLDKLPDTFDQCSVTGGEPTLNPLLTSFLKEIRKRFSKVVLNTNGSELKPIHAALVDYVNISRHHYDDQLNAQVFGTSVIPDTSRLKYLCSLGDTTINCVLADKFADKEFVQNYIAYAKTIGASVAFRKYFNNLEVLRDIDTDDTLVDSHSCPACLHRRHLINNVQVTFKYSVKETCEAAQGVYELILQANGDLTYDWEGTHLLMYKE